MAKQYTFLTDQLGSEQVEVKGKTKYYITGYISTKDRDVYDDIVTEEGLSGMLKQIQGKNIKLDFEHEAWRKNNPAILPVGRIIEAKRDEKGIFVKAQINDANSRFKEVWGSIKNGNLDAFSIAYKATSYVHKIVDGVKTRLLNGVELLNVALTGNPVNPECKMVNVFMKSLEDIKMSEENNVAELKGQLDTKSKELEEKSKEVTELKSQLEEKSKEITSGDAKLEEKSKELEEQSKILEEKSKDIEKKAKEMDTMKEKLEKTEAEVKGLTEKLDNPVIKAQLKSMEAANGAGAAETKSKGPLDNI